MKTISLTLTALAFAVAAASPALADQYSNAQNDVQHAISAGDASANQFSRDNVTEGRQAAVVSNDQTVIDLQAAKDHIGK